MLLILPVVPPLLQQLTTSSESNGAWHDDLKAAIYYKQYNTIIYYKTNIQKLQICGLDAYVNKQS